MHPQASSGPYLLTVTGETQLVTAPFGRMRTVPERHVPKEIVMRTFVSARNSEWRFANTEWRFVNTEWRMTNTEWRAANTEWRMANTEW